MDVRFVDVEEIDRLISELPAEKQEEIAARIIKKLSPEAKARVLGLSETGLTVITGSFVSLNSEVAVNIQDSGDFDPEALVKALLEFKKASK